MNIFQFLGIPESPKVTQNVKNFHEVIAKNIPSEYWTSMKYDGVSCLLVVHSDGAVKAFTRTGLAMTNTIGLTKTIFDADIPVGVYCCELISIHGCSLEELSGVVNPNRVEPLDMHQIQIKKGLELRVFDYVTLTDYIAGTSIKKFSERYAQYAEFDYPYEMMPVFQQLMTVEEMIEYSEVVIEEGSEGVVGKLDVPWIRGHKGKNAVKIVRGIHVDLRCTGIKYGTGKDSGRITALAFNYKGNGFYAGSGKGWTDAKLDKLTADYCAGGSYPVGQIIHVYGLQESSKGVIRLPKFAEIRIDKEKADGQV